jgi:hypothetical protein
MRLSLITTSHSVLGLDEDERFFCIHSGKGPYYGMALAGSNLYVASRGDSAGPDNGDAGVCESGSVLVFDSNTLEVVDELRAPFPIRDMHGVACIDGKLFITCAADNLVAIHDLTTGRWEEWYPSVDVGARHCDINHFNTIAVHENRLVLLAHNRGASQLLFYDRCSFDLCKSVRLGQQAHDIYSIDGVLGVCSSAEGRLVSTAGWTVRTGGFPRGIAFTSDSILLGISQIAERGIRSKVSSVLRRFTPDWHYQCDYVLDEGGMVLDILPIEVGVGVLDKLQMFRCGRQVTGTFNELIPGNVISPGADHDRSGVFDAEWHGPEGRHRWTAACEARMRMIANPGETAISVTALNGYPGEYRLDVYVDGQHVGYMQWGQAGESTETFALPAGSRICEVLFRVPRLWRPSKYLQTKDERKLGIAIVAVVIQ